MRNEMIELAKIPEFSIWWIRLEEDGVYRKYKERSDIDLNNGMSIKDSFINSHRALFRSISKCKEAIPVEISNELFRLEVLIKMPFLDRDDILVEEDTYLDGTKYVRVRDDFGDEGIGMYFCEDIEFLDIRVSNIKNTIKRWKKILREWRENEK